MIVRVCTLSYFHHQIGSVNHWPLFRVRSWNNGMLCMSYYVLIKDIQHHHLPSHHSSVQPCCLATPTWNIISSQYHKSLHNHSHKFILAHHDSATWLYESPSRTSLHNASLHIQIPIAQCDPATWLSYFSARPIPDSSVRPCRWAAIPHYLT